MRKEVPVQTFFWNGKVELRDHAAHEPMQAQQNVGEHLVLGVQIGDVHQVNILVCRQVVIGAVGALHPMFLGESLCLLLQV